MSKNVIKVGVYTKWDIFVAIGSQLGYPVEALSEAEQSLARKLFNHYELIPETHTDEEGLWTFYDEDKFESDSVATEIFQGKPSGDPLASTIDVMFSTEWKYDDDLKRIISTNLDEELSFRI